MTKYHLVCEIIDRAMPGNLNLHVMVCSVLIGLWMANEVQCNPVQDVYRHQAAGGKAALKSAISYTTNTVSSMRFLIGLNTTF